MNCTSFSAVQKFSADTEKGTDTIKGDPGGVTYRYRLFAVNDQGRSDPSNTVDFVSPPIIPPGLEAEKGKVTAPMVTAADPNASGGSYVWVPTGTLHNYTGTGGPAEVALSLKLPVGTYSLWARTMTGGGTADSFFVTQDGALIAAWHVPASSTWKWNKVANVNVGSAGVLNVAFRLREAGTKLDRIEVGEVNWSPVPAAAKILKVEVFRHEDPAAFEDVQEMPETSEGQP